MPSRKIAKIQEALLARGFQAGPVDGLWGPITSAALASFNDIALGLDSAYPVPLSDAALFEDRITPPHLQDHTGSRPSWLAIAYTYLGLREYKGSRHNPKILEWWRKLRLSFTDDETPWCAAFSCGVLEETGILSPRSAAARSFDWQDWGVLLEAPAPGAVVTFWRKRKDGPYGHSAFAVGRNSQGHIMCLGGNQGNRVSIRPFAVSRVLSYRWPKTHAVPDIGFETLPLLNSDGVVSSDEA